MASALLFILNQLTINCTFNTGSPYELAYQLELDHQKEELHVPIGSRIYICVRPNSLDTGIVYKWKQDGSYVKVNSFDMTNKRSTNFANLLNLQVGNSYFIRFSHSSGNQDDEVSQNFRLVPKDVPPSPSSPPTPSVGTRVSRPPTVLSNSSPSPRPPPTVETVRTTTSSPENEGKTAAIAFVLSICFILAVIGLGIYLRNKSVGSLVRNTSLSHARERTKDVRFVLEQGQGKEIPTSTEAASRVSTENDGLLKEIVCAENAKEISTEDDESKN